MADKLKLPPVIPGLHRKPIVPHYFEPDADAHVTYYPPGCIPPKRKQMIAHHSGGRPRMLSEKDVERCTELRRAGRTYEQIGDEMGCSGGTISRVLKERKDGVDTGK